MVKAPETKEIATTQDGRDITRGYVDPNGLLQPQDTVLLGRGGGDLSLYEAVLRDDQVKSTFQQRRMAVVSREWTVEPGGKKRLDIKAADFVREQLENILFDNVTEKMLYGVFYGYAIAECLWARDSSNVVLDAIKVRKQRRFKFGADGNIRLITTNSPLGELLPERKFWTFCTGADNDDEPYGLGLAHWLYWPTYFKRHGLKFWLVHLEKFGSPTTVGKHDRGATETEKGRLLAALAAVQTDSGIAIPKDVEIDLLEATRGGAAGHDLFMSKMDAAISKIVLSQTMTTDDGSSRAQAGVHMEVRREVVKADADLVCQSFNRGPVRWLTEWNFPGAEPPLVWRVLDDDPDLTAQADREKTIVDMGIAKPTLKHIQDTYGGEWEAVKAPEPAIATGATAKPLETSPTAEPAFADPSEPDLPDMYAEHLDDATKQVMSELIDPIRELVMKAKSLEEVRDKLLDLYGDMPINEFAAIMQRALAAAELAGNADVMDETGDG